ncbi:uncharacterized protein LOC126890462 [Diabrotica virgifera virgifera]|uniref:MADF domain-containing protein n=1 Tax=Diabrotica virgifera virgifera TaxID=50390 RepID=A0ABM5KYW4_DIAVI|nr:uncharacterized protein LOC126890462 [Diabrotica virgifera virgifera]
MSGSAIPLDEEGLVNMVEQYPQLWDQKCKEYKDRIAKENAWQSIAVILEARVKECQELWEYLRTKFIRERNKRNKIKTGSASQTNTWTLYDRMGFLAKGIQTRRTKSNILFQKTDHESSPWSEMVVDDEGILSSVPTENDSEVDEDILNESGQEGTSESDCVSLPKTTTQLPCTPKVTNEAIGNLRVEKNIKRKGNNEVSIDKLVNTCTSLGRNIEQILTNNDTDQEDYHFAMALMQELKKIPNNSEKIKLKASFFMQIADVVDKYS